MSTAHAIVHLDRKTMLPVGKIGIYSSPPAALTMSSKGPMPLELLQVKAGDFASAREVALKLLTDHGGAWPWRELIERQGVERWRRSCAWRLMRT